MAEEKKSNGCLKAAIIVGVLVVVGGVAMVMVPAMWFRAVKVEEHEERARALEAQQAIADRTVTFQRGAIPKFPPHKAGEEVKREQFVALMVDDLATELARKEFQRTADGATVRWLVETGDIFDSDGVVHGHFVLPYEIVSGNSMSGSAVNLNCEFLPESKDALLGIRRGDWVTVEGTLSFDGREAKITEAKIVTDQAETPESP